MAQKMGDLVSEQAATEFVGRTEELRSLLEIIEANGPLIIHLHGIGGVGKTSLLNVFADCARQRGAVVINLDCRVIEPTTQGFLRELGGAAGVDLDSPATAATRLAGLGSRVVLAFDTYELFRLLDSWLRQTFVPLLSQNVRIVFAGREAPTSGWRSSPGWQGLFRSLPLGSLKEADALQLLTRTGMRDTDAHRVNRFAHGHPLALRLASAASLEQPDLNLEDATIQTVLEELTQMYLSDVDDPLTRQALDAASVIRRSTRSLLRAMLPGTAPQDVYDRLRGLPFVSPGRDGLRLHETVQQAIASSLRASDPTTHRSYRRAAWRQLREEVGEAVPQDTWRYTADLLYIIENPIIREAFFPSDTSQLPIVETALPGDGAGIVAMTTRHEAPAAAAAIADWWSVHPETFSVARDRNGELVGYYSMFDPQRVSTTVILEDPITRAWWQHLKRAPISNESCVLFCRRWMNRERGELPSPSQAASWLDMKRSYMMLRPRLQRVYLTVCDLETYGPIATELGFKLISEADVELDGIVYHTAALDFGTGSVDGWLARHVARELGITDSVIIDRNLRELKIDGEVVPLTQLEFRLLERLAAGAGKPVSRVDLREDVWDTTYDGGSNVVDAAVRSLRKKLGDHASMIETVTGIGYRFRES